MIFSSYKLISRFINQNFFLFEEDELIILEKGFHKINKNIKLNFLPDFTNIFKN